MWGWPIIEYTRGRLVSVHLISAYLILFDMDFESEKLSFVKWHMHPLRQNVQRGFSPEPKIKPSIWMEKLEKHQSTSDIADRRISSIYVQNQQATALASVHETMRLTL